MTQLGRDLACLSRRRALILLGGAAGGVALGACDGAGAQGPGGGRYGEIAAKGADGTPCLAFPAETEGPFAAHGGRGWGSGFNVLDQSGIERRDITTSFAGLSGTAEGVPLDLEIRLLDVDNRCAPLAGRPVYVWHCDAGGRYSLYELAEANYLRGLQVSDGEGIVRFRTVFPACYPGRFPHIHFEVFPSRSQAASGRDSLLTSQFALPASVSDEVYRAAPGYRGSVATFAGLSLERDGVFGDNSPAQRAAQTLAMTSDPRGGYRAVGTVGLTARIG